MPPFIPPPPSFELLKVETVPYTEQTEIVFFDQSIDFIPRGAQVLVGVFADPSGEGHLEELKGVSIQIDADSGILLNSLCKGQPTGSLAHALRERTDVQLSLHIEKHDHVFLPHLTVTDTEGAIEGTDLDCPWRSMAKDALFLPAFSGPPASMLSAFVGFYSENGYRPEFGSHNMCVWPEDAQGLR
jgi:hypothetical protein